jgi:hypothetical protein
VYRSAEEDEEKRRILFAKEAGAIIFNMICCEGFSRQNSRGFPLTL